MRGNKGKARATGPPPASQGQSSGPPPTPRPETGRESNSDDFADAILRTNSQIPRGARNEPAAYERTNSPVRRGPRNEPATYERTETTIHRGPGNEPATSEETPSAPTLRDDLPVDPFVNFDYEADPFDMELWEREFMRYHPEELGILPDPVEDDDDLETEVGEAEEYDDTARGSAEQGPQGTDPPRAGTPRAYSRSSARAEHRASLQDRVSSWFEDIQEPQRSLPGLSNLPALLPRPVQELGRIEASRSLSPKAPSKARGRSPSKGSGSGTHSPQRAGSMHREEPPRERSVSQGLRQSTSNERSESGKPETSRRDSRSREPLADPPLYRQTRFQELSLDDVPAMLEGEPAGPDVAPAMIGGRSVEELREERKGLKIYADRLEAMLVEGDAARQGRPKPDASSVKEKVAPRPDVYELSTINRESTDERGDEAARKAELEFSERLERLTREPEPLVRSSSKERSSSSRDQSKQGGHEMTRESSRGKRGVQMSTQPSKEVEREVSKEPLPGVFGVNLSWKGSKEDGFEMVKEPPKRQGGAQVSKEPSKESDSDWSPERGRDHRVHPDEYYRTPSVERIIARQKRVLAKAQNDPAKVEANRQWHEYWKTVGETQRANWDAYWATCDREFAARMTKVMADSKAKIEEEQRKRGERTFILPFYC